MRSQILRSVCHSVRWGVFRKHLKSIDIRSDSFIATDGLKIDIKTFTNTIKSVKIG